MRTTISIAGVILFMSIASCRDRGPQYKMDFSTPQGAVLMKEDAYRRHDVEGVVAASSFRDEAKLMLKKRKPDAVEGDYELFLTDMTAKLEAGFRKQVKERGFPFVNFTTTILSVKDYSEGMVVVGVKHEFDDGTEDSDELLVTQTDKGWRCLMPLKMAKEP